MVRELKPIGTWSGKPMTLHLTMADMEVGGADGCAVFLQQNQGGAILAAAQSVGW